MSLQTTIDPMSLVRLSFLLFFIFHSFLLSQEEGKKDSTKEKPPIQWLMDFGVGLSFPGYNEESFIGRAEKRTGDALESWDVQVGGMAYVHSSALLLKRYNVGLGISWIMQPHEIGEVDSSNLSVERRRWHLPIYAFFEYFILPHGATLVPSLGLQWGISLERVEKKTFDHSSGRVLDAIDFSPFGKGAMYLSPSLRLTIKMHDKATIHLQYQHAFHFIQRPIQYPILSLGFTYLISFKRSIKEENKAIPNSDEDQSTESIEGEKLDEKNTLREELQE